MVKLFNFLHTITLSSIESGGNQSSVTTPLYTAISKIGPYAISIVLVLSLVYSIILGVQYSKSTSDDERKAAQKKLISFVIGAVVVIGLITLLYAIREPLAQWANSIK